MSSLYILRPNLLRVLVPKALLLFLLALLFYGFLLLNVWLGLELRLLQAQPPLAAHALVLLILFLACGVQLLLDLRQAEKMAYQFSDASVSRAGRQPAELPYASITSSRIYRGIFDSLFKTGTISITGVAQNLTIRHVGNVQEVHDYLRQMVETAKARYQPVPARSAGVRL